MKRGVKKKAHENLTSTNISKVIGLLEPKNKATKPITKKEACQMLSISYNTTRLGKIISEHKDHLEFIARRKAQNRGKPASKAEIAQSVSEYLTGESVSEIAKRLFRSPGFVKGIINRVGVPERSIGEEKKTVDIIPDSCVGSDFREGEIVWSAKYHRTAIIRKQLTNIDYEKEYGDKCYRIYVLEPVDSADSYFPFVEAGGFNAISLAYDLGKLDHLEEYGVDLTRL